ncbi:hypothetical protein [Leuconostoc citreum]|uniref:hypothetical protein n=1 Tax=Leuconostoc citreum TaxID=33964 RepID=UPI0019103DA5|nr:hypothetical protein [Leuconostoc citreum]QQE97548.1 hypothetical protein LeuC0096_05080 [Leuconostoc citreum]
MDEQTKQRLRHIRDATEVNTRHQQGFVTRNSVERHERASVQIKSEVMENRQIDYKSHMKWLKN